MMYAVESFIIALVLCVLWLVISMVIPPLRRNHAVRYGFAMVIAAPLGFFLITHNRPMSILGGLMCAGLMFFQMRRAIRNDAE
jgi:hypothetical protein